MSVHTLTYSADLCIVSGRVFDGRTRLNATAIAVKGNRIVRISDDAHVLELCGSHTRIVDAKGGSIHPGFVDAHAHAVFAGVERLSLDLTSAHSAEETYELIRVAVKDVGPGTWITGGGWSHDLFEHPTRQELDAISTEHPIALSDAGHHTLWVNSLALEIAGVDRDTPEPANGHIYRDADGDPTGYLNETAAELIGQHIPPPSDEMVRAGLLNAQQHLWSIGVTGWHEAILGEYNGKADCTFAYTSAITTGELKSRVSGALWVPAGTTVNDVDGLVTKFVHLRERNAAAGFDTASVKVMVDGVPHGATAALLEPYCSHGPGAKAGAGQLHHDSAALAELILQLDALGFAMHLHIMGDRGIRVALDAIESARIANGVGPRHHIAHLSMIHPDDARRFGPLGVTANMQALWAAPDPHVVPMIGESRMRAGYPFRAIVDSGADLAMGSDWPVSPAHPWLALHVAVNRALPVQLSQAPTQDDEDTSVGQTLDVLDAQQSLTLTEAFAAYTSGSASLVLGTSGRLQVGELADIAVTTVDPFGLPPERLFEVATALTVVAGEVVFEA